MNQSTISARIAFARNCVRGAEHAKLTGQPRFAAELRASAREAIAAVNAATAHRGVTPARQRARAIAATLLQGFH